MNRVAAARSPADGPPPHRRRKSIVFAMALLLAIPALPQAPRNADLDRIRGEILRLRQRLDVVRSQTQNAQQQLESANLELDLRTRELDLAIDLQTRVEEDMRSTQGQIATIGTRIEQQKKFLGRRLAALYRLGGLSYLRMLLSIDQNRNPIDAMSMLSYLVSRDARAVARFQASRDQLTRHVAELAVQKKQVDETRRVVEQRRQAVAVAQARQQRLLASLRAEGSRSEVRIAELEEKAKRLERLVEVLSKQSAGLAPKVDIRTVQGALAWPVQGKVIEQFGKQRDAKFSTVTFNNGLKIAGAPGTDVHAIFPGTVLFSQWFKGYGNLIILDHGNRVFSLYGNLKAPRVAAGDHVNAGQTIAGVGESEEAQTGYLYFEIRQDNKPEDPRKWLR